MNRALTFPDPTHARPVSPPIVFVKDDVRWEYKRVARNLATEAALSEAELNALGAEGWELAGSFVDSPFVYFYFKRRIEK